MRCNHRTSKETLFSLCPSTQKPPNCTLDKPHLLESFICLISQLLGLQSGQGA